jgi:hypothetical protein
MFKDKHGKKKPKKPAGLEMRLRCLVTQPISNQVGDGKIGRSGVQGQTGSYYIARPCFKKIKQPQKPKCF